MLEGLSRAAIRAPSLSLLSSHSSLSAQVSVTSPLVLSFPTWGIKLKVSFPLPSCLTPGSPHCNETQT